jgi:cleavage and polyadenylation specificity factor subunit 4
MSLKRGNKTSSLQRNILRDIGGPISTSTIEYDFEEYALNHGIPETLDPLPYRKAGSVFATGDDAEPILTSAKHDPRLRTVVCRHWLRDLCMKGTACEFLHQYDLNKMPLCRHGERCKIKDCPFRHISEENRMECAFYKSGFCIHGPFCRYKHMKRLRDDLPIVADFTLGLSQMQAGKVELGGTTTKRPAPKPNEFYKISLCKHYAAGDCPFGEGCHFAHGEAELRTFPRKGENNDDSDDDDNNNNNLFAQNQQQDMTPTIDYFQGGAAGGGKSCPIIDPENASFFIVLASSQQDLIISTIRKEWYVQRSDGELINAAYYDEKNGSTRQVMIFFTVHGSKHIQGAAMVVKPATYQEQAHQIQWYRTTELSVKIAYRITSNDFVVPNDETFCLAISQQDGNALMKAIWNSPLLSFYEAWDDYEEGDIPEPENILTDFRGPNGMRSSMILQDYYGDEKQDNPHYALTSWPTMPVPGFIFGCSSDTMDECLGRGIFGLPAHMKHAASYISPGATIFLFNVTDRLLFGIFEALTSTKMNMIPTAFSKNPKATTSPFPVQIRIRVALECPPLEDTDPVLNDILRARGGNNSSIGRGNNSVPVGGRIGPLSHAQTVAVASLLASQCGALQYMMEYQKGLRTGETVKAPPIALPPRQIKPQQQELQVTSKELNSRNDHINVDNDYSNIKNMNI